MKSIRYLCRLTCASWINFLWKSGSELGWDLGFKIRFLVEMVLGAPVGSPPGYSINTFLGLALENSFGTHEGSLVGVSLGPLSDLMVGTG